MSQSNEENIRDMLARMKPVDAISNSMCSAKWLQTTLLLQNGHTHSCHHPAPHKIPLDEIKKDPSALHNTKHKKKQRKMMLCGQRPKECQYCWNIEDLGKNHFSDRTYKSTDTEWSTPYLHTISDDSDQSINPSYLEVSFENTCNFKCIYCSPDISSKWMEEIKTHGPIQLKSGQHHSPRYLESSGKVPYEKGEHNPYIDAFWKWWPKLYPSLNTFRITGGEPLLSQNTWKVLDEIIENPRKDFNLAINTNLGVPTPLIDKLCQRLKLLDGKVNDIQIYTSLESVGRQAEYIRHGLDTDAFINHTEYILANTNCRVSFMVTFNLLSAPGFTEFLQLIFKLRQKYNSMDSYNRIPLMISYLRWPEFLDMRLLPVEMKAQYVQEYREFAHSHTKYEHKSTPGRIYLEEIDQIERLCNYMQTEPPNKHKLHKDLSAFLRENDRRRGLNFQTTFPQLAGLIEE